MMMMLGTVMVAYTMPQQTKIESDRLTLERDNINFIGLRFERGQVGKGVSA